MKLFNKKSTKVTGQQAEKIALHYLKKQGLKLEETNYHCRFGEIDIIMREDEVLVFIEVRSRAQKAQVSAVESITPQKIHRIRKTAEHYLMQYDEQPDCRFDVIAMTHNHNFVSYTIEWIRSAF